MKLNMTKLKDSFLFCVYYCVIIILGSTFCDERVEVRLKEGLLSGKVEQTFIKEKNYVSFKGIPYAEPPVGKLRFQESCLYNGQSPIALGNLGKPASIFGMIATYHQPPLKNIGWEGTLEAHENKPTCPQFNTRRRNGESPGISGSEDCLHLNIFTPNLDGSAPVVVFDYNDNFKTGFNSSETYSPDFFVEEGVIVAHISHRLGLLGYLTTEDEVITGNNGIRDYILGLKWIRSNIEKFGGDPKRVTLMGNRGGAALANILLYSEQATGLFSAVIMQSGTALESVYFYNEPKKKAFELGHHLNLTFENSEELLEELQKVKLEKLIPEEVEVLNQDEVRMYQINIDPFTPTIERDHDEAIITDVPEHMEIINDVPVLIGLNSREGLDFVSMFIIEPRFLENVDTANHMFFPVRTGFRFDNNSAIYKEAVSEINQFYFRDGYLHTNNILEYAELAGDMLEGYAVNLASKTISSNIESPVYYYMFDFRGSLNENSEFITKHARFPMEYWGATIADELCYLHLCSRIKNRYRDLVNLVSEQPEMKVVQKMVRLWTNFIKTRNPTPTRNDNVLKDFTWKPISKESPDSYLHITKLLKMKENPLGIRAVFWDIFLEKYKKMAVSGVVSDTEKDKQHEEL